MIFAQESQAPLAISFFEINCYLLFGITRSFHQSRYIINMNDSRRDFLKKAALLSGGAGVWSVLPASVHKALAISPDPGTTFYDAGHVVMLMQENRSFDHCFGTLKGVRGFNDPRAITLPDKNPVWFQPDKSGNRFPPFRLNIKDTKAAWMGGVPHSWNDQVDARNDGKYDRWIEAKRPGNKDFREIPLTMGYYTREDIPFYHALADAFTVCDQHFCASISGTTTNRSYFWTGKTHGAPGDKPKVRNGELTYNKEGNWPTFPERLEDHGISWKVYQNEVSLPTNVEDESLLANFTDNNLEWFSQYGVRFSSGYHAYLKKQEKELPLQIQEIEVQMNAGDADKKKLGEQLAAKKNELLEVAEHLEKWSQDEFKKLNDRAKNLHHKAFTTNIGDPDYHKVEDMTYTDGGEERVTKVPKGDILHQFRKDVKEGSLPTVSWLVAPQKFSDHPSAPWYGAWYISEVLDILTQDPEVWKKTIFILNYDENDGYFDHIPPFVAPNPSDPDTGKISSGIEATGEFVTREEEMRSGFKEEESRTSPVGLGYRVPMIIASPWSRGGWVNSEVCDITSTIQFLEKFLSKKTGRKIEEPNISSWRRTVSGDLTSVFRLYDGEKIILPEWLDRDKHVQEIFNARFKGLPDNYPMFSADKVSAILPEMLSALPVQEPGTKPSNALKYELHADGRLSDDGSNFIITFRSAKDFFGEEALGSGFNVYAPGIYWNKVTESFEPVKTWAFAVKAGTEIEYHWPLQSFQDDHYHLRVYGPNGFFREFRGKRAGAIEVSCEPVKRGKKMSRQLKINITNPGEQALSLRLTEDKYEKNETGFSLKPGSRKTITIDTASSQGWYDFRILSAEPADLLVCYAGRLETGQDSISDPYMGREKK
jgi:phospholipase C